VLIYSPTVGFVDTTMFSITFGYKERFFFKRKEFTYTESLLKLFLLTESTTLFKEIHKYITLVR